MHQSFEKRFTEIKVNISLTNNFYFLKKRRRLYYSYSHILQNNNSDNYYLRSLIKPHAVKDIMGNSILPWTSSGMRLLQYALFFGAKEIYVTGLDLGRGGYSWGRSNHWCHEDIDENFVKIISKKYRNVYSLSAKSPIAKYIRVKSF